jgi:FPC/CPF motif-containing protein YcgG
MTLSAQANPLPSAIVPVANPFDSELAILHSSYSAYEDGSLRRVLAGSPTALEEFVHDSFRALVLNPRFTCVAAKSAIRSNNYRFGHYAQLGATPCIEGLARDLFSFVGEQDSFDGFSTFVATFKTPSAVDENEFESLLWQTLRSLSTFDAPHHAWDPEVSDNPEDPNFGFSFGGRAFFVVGLHSASSRFTRRFAFPTLVFNSHAQFEALRKDGRYERVQDVIRARDVALQGNVNANLADFGKKSEAAQYSGRAVEPGWRCPFHH